MSSPTNPFARIPDRHCRSAQGRATVILSGGRPFQLHPSVEPLAGGPQASACFQIIARGEGFQATPRALKGFGPVLHLSSSVPVRPHQ